MIERKHQHAGTAYPAVSFPDKRMANAHPPPTASRLTVLALAVVVAAPVIFLLAAAVRLWVFSDGGLDDVGETVQRVGRLQQVEYGADRHAAELGLSAELAIDPRGVVVQVHAPDAVSSDGEASLDPLRLHLEHPIEARLDRDLTLRHAAGAWRGEGFDHAVAWRVSLLPGDGRWRLVGRWSRGAERIDLQPALESGHARR